MKIKLLFATVLATLSTTISASTVNLKFDLVWEQSTDISLFGTRATMGVVIDSATGPEAGSVFSNSDVRSIDVKSIDGTYRDTFNSLGAGWSDDWLYGSVPLFSIDDSGSAILNLTREDASGGYLIFGGQGNTGRILQMALNNGTGCATPFIIVTPQEESGQVREAASIIGPFDSDNVACLGFTLQGVVVQDSFSVPEPTGILLLTGGLLAGFSRRMIASARISNH